MTDHPQRIPEDVIEEVRRRTSLVAEAARHTELREKRRGDWWGRCPFHTEATGSFHVIEDRGFFKCFGCGEKGNVFAFLELADGMRFREAVDYLAGKAGVDLPGAERKDGPRPTPAPVVAQAYSPERDQRSREDERRKAFDIWRGRRPLAGTVAETYLCEARGIRRGVFVDCPSLGFLPECKYWIAGDDDRPECIGAWPALVAALQHPSGKFAGVHMTYLLADGSDKVLLYERPGKRRSAKKVRGQPMGAAIHLTPARPWVVCGEGIETTLTVVDALDGQAGGLCGYSLDNIAGPANGKGAQDPRDKRKRLPSQYPNMGQSGLCFPAGVERVTFLGDGDTKDMLMLECKLERAVRRQQLMGLAADMAMSPNGLDFNDWLRGAGV